ncbi:MAG: DNA polymerase II large subunit [Nanoarchaeota archaeon]
MYLKDIERQVRVAYSLAAEARSKGLDPISRVEVPLATDLPERVTGLVSALLPQVKDIRIEKRIRELEKQFGFLDPAVAFVIADEIATEKFCKFTSKIEAIEAGIRIGFAYLTLGSVASPLEGFTKLELGKNAKGEDYFILFYSGPIRSAGGTAASISVVLADYLREKYGYGKYDPNEDEVGRAVIEVLDYHERITNLQYLPSEQEISYLASNLPVQISGDPTEDLEVSLYKNMARVNTTRLRGGFCLVMAECLAQKASKVSAIVQKLRSKDFVLSDWDFLEELAAMQKKKKSEKKEDVANYIKDIVAGRPILAHPSYQGGFRLRYGRTRASGYSCVAIHTTLPYLINNFIAVGTQLRMEKPGKSAAVTFCDSIEGPIIKLDNSTVLQVSNIEEAKRISSQVKEILYLGDILISYGDFYNRNHTLLPCGFNEEWWQQELAARGVKVERKASFEDAVTLSREHGVALHPSYTHYWTAINAFQFRELLKWLLTAKIDDEVVLTYRGEELKRVLELLGVPHIVIANKIVINKAAKSFLFNLGNCKKDSLDEVIEKIDSGNYSDVLSLVNELSEVKIKDKAGSFIGARMGRPEKAKLRKLTGNPNVLFPVGEEGGRLRSFQEATNGGIVRADFPIYYCSKCKRETIYYVCEECDSITRRLYLCPTCNKKSQEKCELHKKGIPYEERALDIKRYLVSAKKKLNFTDAEMPPLIKGVKGTSSAFHIPEHLAKGILRALYGLTVNKDGTMRIDLTELPLTHFKPLEIGTPVKLLRALGYTKDIDGKELVHENQVLELKEHDIVVPAGESLEERVDSVLIKMCNFIDNLLVRFYGLRLFYEVKSREDLVGKLVVGLAPHTSVGVIGRIIGFSSAQALYAHPLWHAAMRRDADGDETSLILLLDVLINFSKSYLPDHRGSTQDAPLILNTRIKANEVDDMVFDIETVFEYPLELYQKAENFANPREVKIPQVRDFLESQIRMAYTHEITNLNHGVMQSAYKKIATMGEKVVKQMEVAERIRAVDTADVARLVIERHFIRDIRGNLRKFSSQQFRCVKCNTKYRRPPLYGSCRCGGRLIFTIAEGGIVKYLEPALELARKYEVSPYIKQSLELTKMRIESIFGREKEKQVALQKWF